MSEIITPPAFSGASIQRVMAQSLQVFRFEHELEGAIDLTQSWDVMQLVKVEDQKFVALRQAKTRDDRFQIHCNAHNIRDRLPPIETIRGAFNSVKVARAARPSEADLDLLVGKVLDFWIINSDTAAEYGSGLAWKLGECPRQSTERLFHRRKSWLSIPVIAGAFDHLIDTYRPAYGKPPHLPDVLEECGRQSDRLIRLHDSIQKLGQTHELASKLIEFTDDSYPNDDDDWGGPDDD